MSYSNAVPEWTLGWRMRRALEHAGLQVDDIAALLGVSRSTVSRWVNDRGPVRAVCLREWAARCGVDYGWLAAGARGSISMPTRTRWALAA